MTNLKGNLLAMLYAMVPEMASSSSNTALKLSPSALLAPINFKIWGSFTNEKDNNYVIAHLLHNQIAKHCYVYKSFVFKKKILFVLTFYIIGWLDICRCRFSIFQIIQSENLCLRQLGFSFLVCMLHNSLSSSDQNHPWLSEWYKSLWLGVISL